MFALSLVIAGLGLIALPGLTRTLGRRLAPNEWARMCVVALLAGFAILEAGALLYAAPAVLRALGIPALALICERLVGHIVPGGVLVGWVATATAVAMPVLALAAGARASRRCGRVWIEPGLGEHRSFGPHDLAVLPTSGLLALSVAGPTTQIVVSQGLVEALAPEELQAVLRHEAAHLEQGHQRWLVLASALEAALAFFPPAAASTTALRTALERSADESAARGEPECRSAVRGALLHVTQAMVTHAAAFSAADTVCERLDALEADPRPSSRTSRLALYTPGALLGGLILTAIGGSAAGAHVVVAIAGHCPV